MISPYEGLSLEQWEDRTKQLIEEHPLKADEISSVVFQVWSDIFASGIGSKPFKIGLDIFPRPQIMAFFLHELIPLEFAQRYPRAWRREEASSEKDMVYVPDPLYSIEIKTSSSVNNIYGNRSYAQETGTSKKSKSGYYLAINFQNFAISKKPVITAVRFGWLDHEDWKGQIAASGQQARLDPLVERFKLIRLPLPY